MSQLVDGTNLPPPVGSPAARNASVVELALAFGEKTHRSTIITPSLVAMPRNEYESPVMLKYKDLYFGVSVPTQQKFRSSAAVECIKLSRSTWMTDTVL